jgi:RNA polymerase sigma-70 factor (ECF subfamily)
VFLAERRRQVKFPQSDLEEVSDELPSVAPVRFKDPPQVLAALAQVDEIYQSAVALFYLEDCSYKDIAVVLEVPVGTVKSRIARGIEQLRRFLAEDEHDSTPLNIEPRSGALVPVRSWNRSTFPASHLCHGCDLNN